MRRLILIFIAACFYYSGLVGMARLWTRRSGQRLIILNYHRATGGDLRRHLLYLRRHYRIMHVEAALEELYLAGKEKHPSADARTPLVLTFDDGYQDNYTHGFALARELEVPFTIYLIPGYVESGAYFWWREGQRLVRRAQVNEAVIEGRIYQLRQPGERVALARLIDTRLRHAHSVAEREQFLASVRQTLAVSSSILEEERPSLPLRWEQVQEMEESGWVSFGAHTMHHPILAYLRDPTEVRQEIECCRTVLEQRLNHPVRSFAYPVGQQQHIGEGVIEAVRQAGYDWALTTHYGFNTRQTDPYLLRRIEADVDQHWLVIAAETAGLWGFFSRLRWLPFVRKYLTNSRQRR
jgi:peptidoglycan/xylan/chitin deacetylase (PgdA/CDA1 family)